MKFCAESMDAIPIIVVASEITPRMREFGSAMHTRQYPSQRYPNANRNQFAMERNVHYDVCSMYTYVKGTLKCLFTDQEI